MIKMAGIEENNNINNPFIEYISDQIFMVNEELKFTLMNSAASRLSGKKPDEMIGKHVSDIFPKEIADKNIENLKRVFKTGQIYSLEEEQIMGGNKYYVSSILNPVKNIRGKTIAVLGIIRDITEQKKAEHKYQELVRNLTIGIYRNTPGPQGHFIEVNPAIIEMFEADSREEFMKHNVSDLYQNPGKRQEFSEKMMKNGCLKNEELMLKTLKGRPFWGAVTAVMKQDDKGQPYFDGTIEDISERKRVEIALRESEEKFKVIFDNANDGFLLASVKDKKFILGNKAICEMTGYNPEEIKTLGVMDIHPKKDLPYVIDQFEKQAKKEIRVAENLPVKRKDGSVIYADINSTPIILSGQIYLMGIFRDITKRKKVEEKLRETNEYLDNLFNYANAPIIVWDTQYKITRFNHAFASLTGRAARDVIGKSIEILFPPINTDASMELIRKTIRGERWDVAEIPILNVDGSVRTVLWNSAVILSPDGKAPIAAIAQGEDITERKRTETELKNSERRLKILFEDAPDAYYLNDLKGTFIDGNIAAEKLMGYKKEELIGKSFLKLKILPADQVIKAGTLLARNLVGLSTGPDEFILNRKDGKKVQAEISTHPVKINGKTLVLGIARDITERFKVEEKIRESEERYRLIFNSAIDLVVQMDTSGTIVDINKRVEERGGYKREELLGKKFTALAHIFTAKSLAIMAANFAKGLIGVEVPPYEVEARSKDGQKFFLEITADLLKNKEGKIIGRLSMLHDVTERKIAEAAREELLHKVEEANKKKTEFVSDVSHELRTPLASIKGFISTIRSDKEMDEKTREEFMNIVEDETDRLTRIIEQLLDISRIEAGRIKLNPKHFNLVDLVFKNLETIKEQARQKEVIIEEKMPKDLPQVYADQDKTAQIMINLLSNAIKYNKKGGKVTVMAMPDDGHVRVDIKDTGSGISQNDLPHMFEKFFRAEKTSSEAPGTGLGLALTKSLVEVQGGNISVESKLNEGSKFSFTLPREQKNDSAKA
jgi:PAS domain S-box-containing protein